MNINDIPNGKSGNWKIETFEVFENSIQYLRCALQPGCRTAKPGKYKRLLHNRNTIMSNTPAELRDHSLFVRKAKGKVLINGLGLGCCLAELLNKPKKITSITVIEISKDVINLVAPFFIKSPKIRIIHADAYIWTPPKNAYYNTIWHDIWPTICSDNLPQMTKLKQKYKNLCGWQQCWAEKLCNIRCPSLYI